MVFDGFAGTGSIGLEAISRGAKRCIFVERDKQMSLLLRENIRQLGCEDRSLVIQGDALGSAALASAPRPLTLAFLDPPYPLVQEALGLRRVLAQVAALVELLAPDGYVVLRTPWPLVHEMEGAGGGEEAARAGSGVVRDKAGRDRMEKERRGLVKRGRSWRRHGESMDPSRAEEQLGEGGEGRGRRGAERAPPLMRHPDDEFDGEEGEEGEEVLAQGVEGSEALREQLERMDEKLANAEAALALPARKVVSVDLSVANAIGPETHGYTTMAVHLYARRPT